MEILEWTSKQLSMTRFIIWNTRGADSATFRRNFKALKKDHNLAMVVLLEIKMSEHKHLTNALHFDAQLQSIAEGLSAGIVIMWKEDLLKLESISITKQGIHVLIKVCPNLNPWIFSAIYASPDLETRKTL